MLVLKALFSHFSMLSHSVATSRLQADRIRIWVAFSHSKVAAGRRRLLVTYRKENSVYSLIVLYTLH